MAVIWQKKVQNQRYEVRSAGKSLRLYTNGVCHSQYHPQKLLTGSIWDLLMLPAFYHQQIKRILVLGVGGGAVIRQLNAFFRPQNIIGVELEKVHLEIAQRFFDVQGENIELLQADAVDWVKDYRGTGFDIIVEDVFTERRGQPVRAIAATQAWCNKLYKLLNNKGILVMNFAGQNEFRIAAANRKPGLEGCLARMKITNPKLDNVVGVYSKQPLESAELYPLLCEHAEIERALRTRYLQYRLRKCRSL